MSDQIGSIFAKLGIVLDEQQMAAASALFKSNVGGMSAEMKRTSREGAESLRLIDEALGIHVSRPITRVIGESKVLGAALAAIAGGAAGFAIGTVLVEQGKRLLEVTGALEGWKEILGLAGETAEQTGKRMEAVDKGIISMLERKVHLQDEYNRLVLGLSGADYEGAHMEALKKETEELRQQLVIQGAMVASKADEKSWSQKTLDAIGPIGRFVVDPTGVAGSHEAMERQKEANQVAAGINLIVQRMQEVRDELKESGWQEYRDGVEAAAEALREFSRGGYQANEALKQLHLQSLQNDKDLAALAAAHLSTIKGPALPAMTPEARTPQLAAGASAAGAQLAAFQGDDAAQLKLAAQAYADTVAPQQKYYVGMQELGLLLQKGLIDEAAYTAATQRLGDELVKAAEHVHKMQEELQKLLERSDSASAGTAAFFKQLQINAAENGKFAFDILNESVKGFENNLASAITNGTRNWRREWDQLAKELETSTLKFAFDKALSGMFNSTGAAGGLSALLARLFHEGSEAPGDSALGMGNANLNLIASLIPHAAGGDVTPGQGYLVGERGPEPFFPSTPGTILPNSAMKGGGDTHIHNYDFRGADASVIARVQQMIEASENRGVARSATLQRETALRKRPG